MSWEAVGAVGEILGAAAVVATLLYLSVQVKQNSVLQKEDARYHMLQNQITSVDNLLRSPDIMCAQYGFAPDDSEAVLAMRADLWALEMLLRWQRENTITTSIPSSFASSSKTC